MDADIEKDRIEIEQTRAGILRTKNEIYAAATEAGKKYIDRFATAYNEVNKLEDEVIQLAKLNSGHEAESLIRTQGRQALAEELAALAGIEKLLGDGAEVTPQMVAVAHGRTSVHKTWSDVLGAIAAPDMKSRQSEGAAALEAIDAMRADIGQMARAVPSRAAEAARSAELAPRGLPS